MATPATSQRPARLAAGIALFVGSLLLCAGALAGTSHAHADQEYTVVTHTFYLAPDGSIQDAEESSTVTAQFVVNQHIWAGSAMPVTVRYNPAGAPASIDLAPWIQQDAAEWSDVTSGFAFQWGGSSDGDTGSCGTTVHVDGINTIQFTQLSAPTLARTCTIFPGNNANSKLVEFDMQIDDDANWSAVANGQSSPAGTYDIVTTLLHELGHAAGLGHSTDVDSVMYFSLKSAQQKRHLTPDDVSGLVAAYPGGAPATATPTATNTPIPVTNTPTSLPTSPTATPTPTFVVPPPANVPFKVRTLSLARD